MTDSIRIQERRRLPGHLRRPPGRPETLHAVKRILRERNLHTVCESARCPNIGECFSRPTAAFMILGDICTRNCGFCGVQKGRPSLPDPDEPKNIALAARALGLKHVVITSVTRDDLPRGGAEAFALTIRELKVSITGVVVEALTPDFGGDGSSLDMVFRERPDVFNHNVETVPSLYPSVRPQADYIRSLKVLERAKKSALFTKSGIMAGLGEKKEEVEALLRDLKDAGCDALTIGQYLSPSRENLPVKEFVSVERFEEYRQYGMNIGIKHIWAGAFVRSSYNAEGFFAGSE